MTDPIHLADLADDLDVTALEYLRRHCYHADAHGPYIEQARVAELVVMRLVEEGRSK